MLAEFLTLLYFIRITRDGADIIGWRPTRARLFEVKSFYKILHTMVSIFFFFFPWNSIWKVKIPIKVAFFVWTAALGKILFF